MPRVSEAAFIANLIEMIERGRVFGAREIILATNHRTLRRTSCPRARCSRTATPATPSCRARSPPRPARAVRHPGRFEPFDDEALDRPCCCPIRTICTSARRATSLRGGDLAVRRAAAWSVIEERNATWRCRREDRHRHPLERAGGFGGRRHRSQHHGHLPARSRVRLRRAVPLQPTCAMLEVGCGNGFSTARFRELVAHVDAIDYAENMIGARAEAFGERTTASSTTTSSSRAVRGARTTRSSASAC